MVVVAAISGMLLFAGATQGFWFDRNKWWETILLLALTFILFRPGFIWDRIEPPYQDLPGKEIFKVADKMKKGDRLTFVVSGETIEGKQRTYTFSLPLEEGKDGKERINNTGFQLDNMFGPMEVAMVNPGHNKQVEAMKKAGVDSGWVIESVEVERDRLPKQIVLIPAYLLVFLLGWNQIRRRKKALLAK
jgi:hypothetical protein